MARTPKLKNTIVPVPITKKLNSSEFILETSRDYSIYVCQTRGIPCVSDGLKDGQRKALFVIKPKTDKIKTISLAGEMISAGIYVHGDVSATETLSLMAAPYCNNVPLLYGVGAFGTRVGPSDWGAPRYTYLKKWSVTDALVYPDYDIIPVKENYDGSVTEPKHYLPLIPLVLLNGISGIAVGYSTEILPHNINDIINATLAAIDGKQFDALVPNYDFLNCRVETLSENSWEFIGHARIDGNVVWIDELPPSMSLEKFKIKLNKLEEDDLIQTYIDRSTEHINVEVRFKRGVLQGIVDGQQVRSAWTDDDVVAFFGLKTKSSQRLVTLDWDGENIRQFSNTTELIKEFVEWRFKFYSKRYQKKIEERTSELNFNRALAACHVGKLSTMFPKAKDKSEIRDRIVVLTKNIILTDDQLDRIASLPSYRWAQDAYKDVCDRIAALTAEIAGYEDILADPKRQRKIYRQEVEQLRKLPKDER